MLLDLIGIGLAAWIGSAEPPSHWLGSTLMPAITFNPRQRAVSNWRREAGWNLDASPGVAAALLLGRDAPQVTRCVRLNNYWCIKRAGWAGEIAADAEDHVAFASAAEGADVAALLLRRYYVSYGRHSALAIISHWAPASCGTMAPAAGRRPARSPADHLTTHGLGSTLRARFLASRGRRAVGTRRLRGRVSVIPDRLIGTRTATPSIVAGIVDTPVDLGHQSLASLPLTALGSLPPAPPARSGPSCSGDDARIRNYAAKAAAGVARSPTDDLKLFDATGLPTPNLARVMQNMSAVEIGPLGAGKALIAAAVEHARRVASQPAASSTAAKGQAPAP